MAKKTSISDIANKLGVSNTLVSLVLNGKHKENRIGDDIASKVLEVARELNYKPNQLARSLRMGHTKLIGLVVADIANEFFAKYGRAVEDEANKMGYTTIFCSSDEDDDKTERIVETLLDRQVDGIILTPTLGSKELVLKLKKANVPLVLFDRYFPKIKTSNILTDNFEASKRAVNHLIDKGYTKIGQLIYAPELIQMKQRIDGYKAALKDNKIRFSNEWLKIIRFENFQEDVAVAVNDLLTFPVNVQAIIFSSGKLAATGLKKIREMRKRIPMDVAVIAFDDNELYQLHSTPISAILQPIDQMGKKSVQMLVDQIENKEQTQETIMLPTEFISRESC